MKNTLFLVACVLFLSGCGSEKDKNSTANNGATSALEKDINSKNEIMKKAMEVPVNTPSEGF